MMIHIFYSNKNEFNIIGQLESNNKTYRKMNVLKLFINIY